MPSRQVLALLLVVVTACSGMPHARRGSVAAYTQDTRWYDVDVVERGSPAVQPVPVDRVEFQRAVQELARRIRLKGPPAEEARRMLEAPLEGDWVAEVYRGEVFTLVPLDEKTSVTPHEDEALRREYEGYCESQGGGDCLGLLEDGLFLRVDDRRTLALALAFDSVRGETREALTRQLLDPKVVVATVLWMAALYLAMWLVPEPTSKAVAAALTAVLLAWVGLDTLYALWDGWAVLATQAHRARTFEELRAAGEQYARVLGTNTARALVMGILVVMGSTAASVARQVQALPGYARARLLAETQGVRLTALGEVEAVTASADGSLTVYMRARPGAGQAGAAAPRPGRPSVLSVFRHRGGNQQVELSNGQRWHLRKGMSVEDIPGSDPVGDLLQAAARQEAPRWGLHRLTAEEMVARKKLLDAGKPYKARLLERMARGKWVEAQLRERFKHLKWNSRGVDAIDLATGHKYEVLTRTAWNLELHGRRMADVFFRMISF